MTEFTADIIEHIGTLSTHHNDWTRELNIVSWCGGNPKIDIRDWNADHTKMSKGITLTEEEAKALYEALKGRYGE